MSTRTSLTIDTEGGASETLLFMPDKKGAKKAPAVIMFPDAFGVRPAAEAMGGKLADAGYAVLVPNLFHRVGKYEPFDAKTVWGDEKERARLGGMMASVKPEQVMKDVGLYIDALAKESDVDATRVGTCGYCMGGMYAFRCAAAHPEKVAAVAAFHAGNLVTDKPDSPHLGIDKIKAHVYLGCADNDRSCTPEVRAQLAAELAKAGVDARIELYRDKMHGFAVDDAPVYDADAAATHWRRMYSLFGDALG